MTPDTSVVAESKKLLSVLDLLRTPEKIVETGHTLRDWIKLMCSSFAVSSGAVAYGGKIVPQTGPDAGDNKFFFSEMVAFDRRIKSIVDQLDSCKWLLEDEETATYLDKQTRSLGLRLVVEKISGIFDQPTGYVWAICTEENESTLLSGVASASSFISLFQFQDIATNTLNILSLPSSSMFYSFQDAAEFVLDNIMSAMSCVGAVIWEVTEATYDRPSLLITSAVAGNAEGEVLDIEFGEGAAGKCAVDEGEVFVYDLWDKKELKREKIGELANPEVVKRLRWRCALFEPIMVFGKIRGVFGCYARRPASISNVEVQVCECFIRKLEQFLEDIQKSEERKLIERRIIAAAPVIEMGLLSLENVHDVLHNLVVLYDKMDRLKAGYRKGESVYDKAEGCTELIKDSSNSLNDIIKSTRADEITLKTVEIQELIKEVCTKMGGRGIFNFTIDYSKVSDCAVFIDARAIKRVFLNLFDNAIYFLDKTYRGNKKITIQGFKHSGYYHVHFMDNGKGIPEFHQNKVFDFLYSTKGKNGSGIGLSICKKIVEAHTGSIHIKSEYNKFTEVIFTLPTEKFKQK